MRYLKTILGDIVDLYQKIDKVRRSDTMNVTNQYFVKYNVHKITIDDLIKEAIDNYVGKVIRFEITTIYGGLFVAVARLKNVTDYGIVLEGVKVNHTSTNRILEKIHILKGFHNILHIQCEVCSQSYLDQLLSEIKTNKKYETSNKMEKKDGIRSDISSKFLTRGEKVNKKSGWIRIN